MTALDEFGLMFLGSSLAFGLMAVVGEVAPMATAVALLVMGAGAMLGAKLSRRRAGGLRSEDFRS